VDIIHYFRDSKTNNVKTSEYCPIISDYITSKSICKMIEYN